MAMMSLFLYLILSLGIGMSLDFDDDTLLTEGQIPSVHRLRARMIKSAIRRTNNLIFKEGKEKIDAVKKPKDRLKEAMRLADEAEEEIKYMKETILALIPTNAPPPEGKLLNLDTVNTSNTVRTEMSTNNNENDTTTTTTTTTTDDDDDDYSNKFVTIHEPPPDPWKKAIAREYGEEFVDDPYLNADEEFVKDYYLRQKKK